jgi:antitoxin CptB
VDTGLDDRAIGRLKWSCRRGLLENDLFVQRFFERHGAALNSHRARGLAWLMELADNDLLDLLLRRTELPPGLGRPEVDEVLALMRNPPPADRNHEGTPP